MRSVEIKKGTGIDGLVRSEPVEETRQLEASDVLSKIIRKYERYFSEGDDSLEQVTEVLSPDQINALLQTSVLYEDREQNIHKTGSFISHIIQNSYNAGHNDFKLNTTGLRTAHSNIGYNLSGEPKKPINVTIEGNVGDAAGMNVKHAAFQVYGNVGSGCGRHARESTFAITGNAEWSFGVKSVKSIFFISGDIGEHCGMEAYESTFLTSNKQTLVAMIAEISTENNIAFANEAIQDHAN